MELAQDWASLLAMLDFQVLLPDFYFFISL
jgi:hypothetical protein